MPPRPRAYLSIIEAIFQSRFRPGLKQIDFSRQDLAEYAQRLGVALPKNLGDLPYSFRYRAVLPASIRATAGEGEAWIIRPVGRSLYRLVLAPDIPLTPNPNMLPTKMPDSTPGVVAKYALSDEQALLARVRYNRLIDIFLGIVCYSLQNHLRTTVGGIGQVETDELYIGLDKRGAHYVIPVQGKGGRDRLGIVQIEQDFAVCAQKFPMLICRPVAAQFLNDATIALFEFGQGDQGVGIVAEKHYWLVPPSELTTADLDSYRNAG